MKGRQQAEQHEAGGSPTVETRHDRGLQSSPIAARDNAAPECADVYTRTPVQNQDAALRRRLTSAQPYVTVRAKCRADSLCDDAWHRWCGSAC
jgi:hypothetical protein